MGALDNYRNQMDIAQVRIYTRKPTKGNKATILVAMVCSSADLGTWQRTLAHRGAHGSYLAKRTMDEIEKEEESKSMRLHWHAYLTWEKLIVDEWRITESEAWCKELMTISNIEGTIQELLDRNKPAPVMPVIIQQSLFQHETLAQ